MALKKTFCRFWIVLLCRFRFSTLEIALQQKLAIFKGKKYGGGERGILHRTPDAALEKPSLLMRLDHDTFIS